MKRSSRDTCTQEDWAVPFPTEDSKLPDNTHTPTQTRPQDPLQSGVVWVCCPAGQNHVPRDKECTAPLGLSSLL
ncbi:hypothetical protein EYF80_044504 [Liparis tanakae]|uniref:Uncharacterized protein n=1 Tax=Liparis tanakae TaxID=230148 RepID=A0A4Z2FXK4_9TELE|nr:hypothetical protein EYF80_044504 [Liparis tanakae]